MTVREKGVEKEGKLYESCPSPKSEVHMNAVTDEG